MHSFSRARPLRRVLAGCVAGLLIGGLATATPAVAETLVESANGYDWDVDDLTSGDTGGIIDGGDDAFDDYGMVRVVVRDGEGNVLVDTNWEVSGFGLTYDPASRTFNTTTPVVVSNEDGDLVEVSRTLWIPEGTDYVRYVDDFTNLTDGPLQVTVIWGGNLGSDSSTEVVGTSSGDTGLTAEDTGALTREGDADTSTDEPATDPVVGYVLGSVANGVQGDPVDFDSDPIEPFPNEGEDQLGHTYDLEIAPDETVSLAYFLYRGLSEEDEDSEDPRYGENTPEEGEEIAKAATILGALRDAPNFTGLSAEARARIANWEMPAFAASPESGDAPTTVNVSGTVCGSSDEGAYAGVVTVAPSGGGAAIATGQFASNATGDWAGTVQIPDGAAAGAYTVNAVCQLAGADRFSYTADAFTVNEAPGDGDGDADVPTGANGYRMVAADGGIFTFGNRTFHGSTGNMPLNQPIVGGATDVSDYDGYWIVARDGGVFAFNAEFHGSLAGSALTSPAVEIEPTPTGNGYWIVQANGKVTAFGGARHHGDMSTTTLNRPIIGMSVAPDGLGYWLVAEDGGIFDFGSADFFGSMGDQRLNAPVIDLAPMPDGAGYHLVAQDGGVFSFGTAQFWGSTGNMTLNQPVIAMLVLPNGAGYWLAASDGGIFSFGPQAQFLGSMGGTRLNAPVLDLIN